MHILFARDPEVKWWIAHTAHILKLCSRPSEVLAKIFRAITWCYLLIQIAVKSALDCPDLAKYSNTFSFHLLTRVPKSNKQIWRPYQHGVYQLAEWMQEEQFLHILFTWDREVKLWRGGLTMIAWRGRVPWSPARQHRASTNIGHSAWLDVSLSVLFCAPTIFFSKGCKPSQLGKMHQTKLRLHSWEGKMCMEGKLIPSFEWMLKRHQPSSQQDEPALKKHSLNALQLLASISSTRTRVDDSVPWPMMTWKSLWLQNRG